uniref:Cadherin domain-containing protein n=1 Tax=Panagrolaimus sp. PS1159 TaxID=55785 RepID=A0AC35F0G9_9BILA
IADGNEEGKFAIDQDSGKITTVAEFDREETDMYTLQIEARSRFPDQALYWTILQVAVTDVNDNAPEFLDSQPIILHMSVDDLNEFGPNMRIDNNYEEDEETESTFFTRATLPSSFSTVPPHINNGVSSYPIPTTNWLPPSISQTKSTYQSIKPL